jgi:hypothetical protein
LSNFIGFAQTQTNTTKNDSIPKAFPILTAEYREALKVFQPQILKPSPEVAGMQQIGHNPVNYYNGKPQISFQLITLPSKELSISTSLSIDAGGIKVEQEATQAGLGINLIAQNTITRTIRGRDDFDGLLRFSNTNQANLNSMKASSFVFQIPNDIEWSFDHYDGLELVTNMSLFCPKNYTPSIVQSIAYLMSPVPTAGEAGKPRLDGESDIFSYQAGAFSGKFLIIPTATNYQIVTTDGSPVKVEILPILLPDLTGNSGFRITTPVGIQYNYTVVEKLISRGGTSFSGRVINPEIQNNSDPDNAAAAIDWDFANISVSAQTITSWNLTSMVSLKDPTDVITLTYTVDDDFSAIALPTRVHNLTHGTMLWRITDNRQKNVLLNQINSPKGRIEFTRSPRIDMRGDLAQKLDKITLFDQFNNQINGYSFQYSYFDSGDNTKPDFVRKRLRLDSFTAFGRDNTLLPPTVLTYNAEVEIGSFIELKNLPNKNSYAQDIWGFYNNEHANETKLNAAQGFGSVDFNKGNMISVALPTLAISSGWGFNNPANRSLNLQYAKLGTLSKITYPTGGSTSYIYELNQINNVAYNATIPSFTAFNFGIYSAIDIGGLRIKSSIIKTDANTISLKRDYSYGASGSNPTMKLMYDMDFSHITNNGVGRPFQTFSSVPQVMFSHGAMGSPVGYSIVKEAESDNILQGNGFTLFEFDNTIERRKASFCFPTLLPNEDVPIADCGVVVSSYGATCTYTLVANDRGVLFDKVLLENPSIPNEYDNKNGLLKIKSVFDAASVLVWKEENFYSVKSTQKIKNLSAVSRDYGDQFPHLWTYFNTIEWIALDSKTTTQYFNSGNLSTTETYTYNANNQQVASVSTTASNGNVKKTSLKYPSDLPSAISTALINQNRVNEILEAKSENITENKEISKVINTFTAFGTKILQTVAQEIRTGVNDGINDIQVFYDTDSNIKRIISRSLPETHYLYAYNGQYAVAEIKGCTETELNAAIASSGTTYASIYAETNSVNLQVTLNIIRITLANLRTSVHMGNYIHTPLVGLKQVVTPNGLKTSFEYDAFNRLQKTRDHEGYLLKQNTYTIGTGINQIQTFASRIEAINLGTAISDYQSNIQHFDNLGRPLQTVSLKASPDAITDIITNAVTYDAYGRTSRSYIPFSNLGNGGLASLPVTIHGDAKPYGYISQYDNSPLNRPLASFDVGEAWHNANKTSNIIYDVLPAGNMPLYTLTSNGATLNGTYPSPLYMTTSIDEQGNAKIEYKDNEGKTIQKAEEESTGNYLRTYYIYDEYNRPKYIIQPESFNAPQSFTENDAYFTAGVFAYHYDSRARVYESHVPSGGWTKMIFDKKDRKVLEQNALQLTLNKWNFTKYDVQNRAVYMGEHTNPNTLTNLQAAFYAHLTPDEVWTTGGYNGLSFPSICTPNGSEVRQYLFYDSYDFRDALAPSITFNSSLAFHANYTTVTGLMTGTVRYQIPTNTKYLIDVVFYDNKNRAIQSKGTHIRSSNAAGEPTVRNTRYNFIGNVTLQKLSYYLSGLPQTTFVTENILDHIGRQLRIKHFINISFSELVKLTYDPVGRLNQKKILPNGIFNYGGALDYIYRPQSPILGTIDQAKKAIFLQPGTAINANYLGIINPAASGGTSINGLQTVDYSWHIRGGLRGINLDNALNTSPNATEGDLFSYKLDYETAGYWDGNIGKQSWANINVYGGGVENRSYIYNYDKASRLKSGIYQGLGQENYSLPVISYDRNGNIYNLQRNGKLNNNYGSMDNLAYTYIGNQLSTVTDAVTTNNQVDFVQRGNASYTYWPDGSLKSDANKEITNITYDTYLKKPTQIDLNAGRWIKISYDGAGKVIKREYSTGEYWEYIDGMILKNGQMYSHNSPEGRSLFKNNTWNYEFEYRDIYGNLRITFENENGKLIEKNKLNYDAFGVQFFDNYSTSSSAFKYQNQEREEIFNLNLDFFKYRVSDPTIGKFQSIDPLAHKYYFNSPFSFQENKFGKGIELEGLELQNFVSQFRDPAKLNMKLPEKDKATIQVYSSTVKNSKISFSQMKELFFKTPEKLLTNSKAEFNAPENSKGEHTGLKKGNTIEIEINGPQNDSYVKVQKVNDSDNKASATFVTLEGHVEKGVINFSIQDNGNGSLTFTIGSLSQVDYGVAPEGFAREKQKESWKEVLNNFIKLTGGKEIQRIIK